ncbi:Abi-alpha family protein [Mariprofundus ferrooxydans]|uniref:Abi-alpha family protein n=1 Tax=Mariprofundus ferrooxydans TaxID=314344 RepID=UPI0014301A76|nr:Abi-alpha family protein [Mariprofundus ferrooxydans]
MCDKGIDLTGIGEVAKAIPEQSWNQLVSTACEAFQKTLAPITELTGGLGRLISAKFDRLIDAEKILAADTMQRASEKVARANKRPSGNAKPGVITSVITESSKQTDINLRDLWANLLAQELIDGSVHPEVVSILARISSEDAQTLARIAEQNPYSEYVTSFSSSLFGMQSDNETSMSASMFGLKVSARKRSRFSFSEKFLESLNLIEREGRSWILTPIGEGFIASVSEPEEDEFV